MLNRVANRICGIITAILRADVRQNGMKVWVTSLPDGVLSLLSKLSQFYLTKVVQPEVHHARINREQLGRMGSRPLVKLDKCFSPGVCRHKRKVAIRPST